MKTLLHLMLQGEVNYNDKYFRLGAAIAAAQYIVVLPEKYRWWQLLEQPEYYLAFVPSFGIALLVIYAVYRATVWLDRHYSWLRYPVKRAVLQFGLGLGVPMLISIACAVVYYSFRQTKITDTVYYHLYLPNIVLMLVFLNTYYLAAFSIKLFLKRLRLWRTQRAANKLLALAKHGSVVVAVEEQLPEPPISPLSAEWQNDDLWLIHYTDGRRLAYHRSGSTDAWAQNIETSIKCLPAADFFMINRAAIVHQNNILSAVYTNDKRRVVLTLAVPDNFKIEVSRNHTEHFAKWCKIDIAAPGPNQA